MPATVRLTVLTGPHKGSRFCFRGPASRVVGRAAECDIRFWGSDRDQCISRCHCELTFDEPILRMHDMGSSNGTFVNGRQLGAENPGPNCTLHMPLDAAGDGDVVTIGGTSLQVNIMDCPLPCLTTPTNGSAGQTNDEVKKDCALGC